MSIDQTKQQVQSMYIEHHSWLQGWLRSKLGCSHQADDLAQDTFTRILAARKQTQINEPRAYLTTIAKGLLVKWFSGQRNQ
ncbi:sigma factor [Methylophaga nitratireducenticrescens]|uniref:sigma factor n=1 Tax=Methylophaga nitratireducenticrescens TaxID=754476 RepID=UPI001FD3D33C|nr:sigma factor [Methylophaga nitratireducenticrescens]